VDDTECFLGQHEHLRPAYGRPQQHLQIHPHAQPRVDLRRDLLHHHQLHGHRHHLRKRSQHDSHDCGQVIMGTFRLERKKIRNLESVRSLLSNIKVS